MQLSIGKQPHSIMQPPQQLIVTKPKPQKKANDSRYSSQQRQSRPHSTTKQAAGSKAKAQRPVTAATATSQTSVPKQSAGLGAKSGSIPPSKPLNL